MKIISEKNLAINSQDKGLIVGYLLAGYPTADEFVSIIKDCDKTTLDILEIGFPSENPYADGEVISKAHEKVDKIEATSIEYFDKLRQVTNKPIWIMAYKKDFIDSKIYMDFAKKGVLDAVVIPDMSCEERIVLAKELESFKIDVLGFVNPEMTEDEMKKCFENFTLVYAQLHVGQTGAQVQEDRYHEMIDLSKKYPHVNSFAGFGINTTERAKQLISEGFRGAIIGTSMIRKLNNSKDELLEFILELGEI